MSSDTQYQKFEIIQKKICYYFLINWNHPDYHKNALREFFSWTIFPQ